MTGDEINSRAHTVAEVARVAAENTAIAITDQLTDLVSRGLLEVDMSAGTLTMSPGGKISWQQSVTLKVKHFERLEQLEKENADLRMQLKSGLRKGEGNGYGR